MDRTSALNNIDIGGGRRGYRDRNLAAGLPGTQLAATDRNAIQEEVLAVIEGLGIAASAGSLAQLFVAIKRAAAANFHLITASRALIVDDAGLVFVNATGGNITLTLPLSAAANGVPLKYRICRIDASANAVTVALAGVNTWFDGTTGTLPVTPGVRLDLMGNGVSSWVSLGDLQGVMLFTASGNFTVPMGVSGIENECWGGGGGGGGGGIASSGNSGSGGNGGGYSRKRVTGLTAGMIIPVTIGGAGAGSVSNTTNGSNGGTTSFGSYNSATGGVGGAAPNGGTNGLLAGVPGIGISGDINLLGNWGLSGIPVANGATSPQASGGFGGGAAMGGGGGLGGAGVNGWPGYFPGGGGGGGDDNPGGGGFNGGAGAAGFCVVRW